MFNFIKNLFIKQKTECDHGLTFDVDTANRMQLSPAQVRVIYPRLHGPCPKGCGFNGIAYVNLEHYVYGDW